MRPLYLGPLQPTSKVELFLTSFNGFQPLSRVTKNSIFDAMGVQNTLLDISVKYLQQVAFHVLAICLIMFQLPLGLPHFVRMQDFMGN